MPVHSAERSIIPVRVLNGYGTPYPKEEHLKRRSLKSSPYASRHTIPD
jgi:hypothetical protein